MAVKATIHGALERMAKIRQLAQAIASTGTDFWDRIDAAADETFENRVKGTNATALDAALADGSSISLKFLNFMTDLNTYCSLDLELAVTNGTYLETLLTSYAMRVPFEAAEIWADVFGEAARLPADLVFPKGTRPAAGTPATSGMHKFGTLTGSTGDPTYAEVNGALDTKVGGAPVFITNDAAATAVTDLTMTGTRVDGTTVDLGMTVSGAGQYAQTIWASQPVNAAGAAAGQKVIPINGITAPFKVGEPVLITKSDDSVQEVGVVASIVADTSITLEDNLVGTYAAADLVLPMFTDIAWKSGSVADGKVLSLWAYPDRIIAL